MKRTDFLKKLLGFGIIPLLPLKNPVPEKKIITLLTFHIRGFQYYEGENLIGKMRTGDMLHLTREPENPYDHNAIAVYYEEHKIGYVPRERNEVLSRLMDSESVKMMSQIEKIEGVDHPWTALKVKIWMINKNYLA